ncbi:MAG: hypothetical protein ACREJ5_28195, partial [Geminicoccaceae bacterium]
MGHGRFPPTFGHSFGRKHLDHDDESSALRPAPGRRRDGWPQAPGREDRPDNRSAPQARPRADPW